MTKKAEMVNVLLLERYIIHVIYSYSNTFVFLVDTDQSQCVNSSLEVGASVSSGYELAVWAVLNVAFGRRAQ